MTITAMALEAAGYKKFNDGFSQHKLGDWYRCSYQKRFEDEYGIRYFISVIYYVANIHGEFLDKFSPSVQFNRKGTVFDVNMLHGKESLEEMEAFFYDLWTKMNVNYYEGGPESDD